MSCNFMYLFIVSNSFLVEILGFSMYRIMLSAKSDTCTSSFLICMHFIFFPCLIAQARSFRSMFNKSGESGHPCLLPDFRGIAFWILSLNMILTEGCHLRPLLCRGTFLLFLFYCFNHKWLLYLIKCFFCIN